MSTRCFLCSRACAKHKNHVFTNVVMVTFYEISILAQTFFILFYFINACVVSLNNYGPDLWTLNVSNLVEWWMMNDNNVMIINWMEIEWKQNEKKNKWSNDNHFWYQTPHVKETTAGFREKKLFFFLTTTQQTILYTKKKKEKKNTDSRSINSWSTQHQQPTPALQFSCFKSPHPNSQTETFPLATTHPPGNSIISTSSILFLDLDHWQGDREL